MCHVVQSGGKIGNLNIARGNLEKKFYRGITKLANIAGGISLLTLLVIKGNSSRRVELRNVVRIGL
jgi:hypothetical protein